MNAVAMMTHAPSCLCLSTTPTVKYWPALNPLTLQRQSPPGAWCSGSLIVPPFKIWRTCGARSFSAPCALPHAWKTAAVAYRWQLRRAIGALGARSAETYQLVAWQYIVWVRWGESTTVQFPLTTRRPGACPSPGCSMPACSRIHASILVCHIRSRSRGRRR